MNTAWTKGLRKESQEYQDIKAAFVESYLLRKRLKEILSDKFDSKVKTSMSNDNFDSPAWAYIQAEAIGYSKAMKEIINLLESTDKTK